MSDLYGIVIGIADQLAIVKSHCWGNGCGKGIVGGITTDFAGDLLPCRVHAAECPCFEREMDEPIADVMGEPLTIRKLRVREVPT